MKTCPQCGAEQALSAKFCTKCGYHFETAAAAQPQAAKAEQPAAGQPTTEAQPNEQLERAKAVGKNYWGWLVKGLKQPGQVVAGGKWFGLVSLALMALFQTISIMRPLSEMADRATESVSGLAGGLFGSDAASDVSSAESQSMFGLFFRVLVFFVLVELLFAVTAWLGKRLVSGAGDDFLTGMTEYGFRVTPTLLFTAIAALLGLFSTLSDLKFTVILLVIGYCLQNVAYFQMALVRPTKRGMDPQYKVFLLNLAAFIVFLILVTVIGDSIGNMVEGMFK